MHQTATFIIVFVVLTLVIFGSAILPMVQNNNLETFQNLGVYPVSVDKPILQGDYKLQPRPDLSNFGAAQIYKNYPVFPATSLNNNNIRYWRRPTNGKCTPADFCGGVYASTYHPIPPKPPQPKWDDGTRVNYYESEQFCD